MPVRKHTGELDAAVPLLGEAFPTLDVAMGGVSDGPFRFEHHIAGDGRLMQQHIHVTARSRVAGDVDPVVAVGLARPGDVWMQGAHGPVDVYRPFIHPLEGFRGGWSTLDIDLVAFETHALRSFIDGVFGLDAPQLAFTDTAPADAGAEQYWYSIASYIAGIMANPLLLNNPVVRGEAFRTAARALLLTFPNTVLDTRARTALPSASRSAVDVAIAYIETRAADDIGLPEIAAAAGVSGITLTRAFRRQLDRTPLQTLRSTRYRRARQDLLAGSPGLGTTVQAVALRWGFAHFGRFANEYRSRFGEHPSATLARAT